MTLTDTRAGSSLRLPAVVAPLLLLVYGLFRFADGLDGDRGNGWAWDVGHVAFGLGILVFGALALRLRRVLLPAGWRAGLTVATAATLLGAAGFLWVIVYDLFPGLEDVAVIPGPVFLLGPALFELGLLALLVRAVLVRPRLLPPWSPVLVLVGFVAIAVELDLLPVGAALVLVGLLPLARGGTR
ncbi:hypothetical protein [Micromonospora halophytica]|uniref:Low temperature requirement A protein (LtrA) n=1 Tax=Micromonospora halophytica TaxID=47864 RepID=A0A1C5HBG7_9ACTN|nr:hypothetical protein [Micromonospora halophytica]SCG43354.1 hypothetical protein GA0070560_103430 [Micromonospora halophytica]